MDTMTKTVSDVASDAICVSNLHALLALTITLIISA